MPPYGHQFSAEQLEEMAKTFALTGDEALAAAEKLAKLNGSVKRFDEKVLAEDLQQIAADLKADVETTDLAAPLPVFAADSGRSSAINRAATRTWTP